ncbi:MAG: DUF4386 domain-containing protein [Actinomycetia bacterium]|nr:DUF4386 domain-containing protein [Actinomycetes bacterium]
MFVAATAAGVASVLVMSSALNDDDLLAAVSSHQGSLLLGELLIFVMLTAMVGTAVLLHPVLRRRSETLALSYVLARAFEVVIISVGLVAGLLLLPLSWEHGGSGVGDAATAGVLAESLKAASDWTGYLGAQMVFSLSALVLNLAFYRHQLVPRWLSVWGLVGVPMMFASGVLVMVESLNSSSSTLNLLVVPLAVQEMVMAVWLIARGFCDVDE